MTALTTRQRDLLQILLDTDHPLGTADLASRMSLTPRQVNYGLKGLKSWLEQRDVTLKVTPGVGVLLDCSQDTVASLANELTTATQFELILTAGQRQQLVALVLLDIAEPLILYQLQQFAKVSRTTILNDLDAIEAWLQDHKLILERRPNFGIQIRGSEQAQRQALAALVWGDTPFGEPTMQMTHTRGLQFLLAGDAGFSTLVARARDITQRWETRRTFGSVAYIEEQLGGRFTDDAVIFLALALAIQTQRVARKQIIDVAAPTLEWLHALPVWSAALQVAKRLNRSIGTQWPDAEIAAIAMTILAAPRNERWPGDFEIDASFSTLVHRLVQHIAAAYDMPTLGENRVLYDSIFIQVVPACLRQRFNLWLPSPPPTLALSDKYRVELDLARDLAREIESDMGVVLPAEEINNIALLLRAAYIRERPKRELDVLVVCPSGMATAQLLVARLKARFPRMGTLRVVSLRELTDLRLSTADLIITTVPLPELATAGSTTIIQVHPLLLPEDIDNITQWLS